MRKSRKKSRKRKSALARKSMKSMKSISRKSKSKSPSPEEKKDKFRIIQTINFPAVTAIASDEYSGITVYSDGKDLFDFKNNSKLFTSSTFIFEMKFSEGELIVASLESKNSSVLTFFTENWEQKMKINIRGRVFSPCKDYRGNIYFCSADNKKCVVSMLDPAGRLIISKSYDYTDYQYLFFRNNKLCLLDGTFANFLDENLDIENKIKCSLSMDRSVIYNNKIFFVNVFSPTLMIADLNSLKLIDFFQFSSSEKTGISFDGRNFFISDSDNNITIIEIN